MKRQLDMTRQLDKNKKEWINYILIVCGYIYLVSDDLI